MAEREREREREGDRQGEEQKANEEVMIFTSVVIVVVF